MGNAEKFFNMLLQQFTNKIIQIELIFLEKKSFILTCIHSLLYLSTKLMYSSLFEDYSITGDFYKSFYIVLSLLYNIR